MLILHFRETNWSIIGCFFALYFILLQRYHRSYMGPNPSLRASDRVEIVIKINNIKYWNVHLFEAFP